MKLNWVEMLAMNNPVRAHLQRRREAPGLAALAPRSLVGADTLVVGCGRGVDIEIAFEIMRVGRVSAIDLDERQVAGDFKIHEKAFEDTFWRYFTDESMHTFYEPGSEHEVQAFATPPWERDLIEKLVLATTREQTRTRRLPLVARKRRTVDKEDVEVTVVVDVSQSDTVEAGRLAGDVAGDGPDHAAVAPGEDQHAQDDNDL